jgi:hypothetical protein
MGDDQREGGRERIRIAGHTNDRRQVWRRRRLCSSKKLTWVTASVAAGASMPSPAGVSIISGARGEDSGGPGGVMSFSPAA